MPVQGESPPPEILTLANGMLAAAGWAAAVMIRITGAGNDQKLRYVIADIAGTLGLFYLVLMGLWGYGLHIGLAVSLAGLAAAAGWTAIFALLQRMAKSRLK